MAYREISDGIYGPTTFFFSFLINEVPLEIIASLLTTVFMLVVVGMQLTTATFFTFWYVIFAYVNSGESLGIGFSSFVTHAGFSITIMSAVVSKLCSRQHPRLVFCLDVLQYFACS
jgi:hypothetical protein